ncbi:MAG: HAD-IA family hydrolase [Bacilli bacterium]|nr:HAD-IA family hydrolase [Bacilli bacterium]
MIKNIIFDIGGVIFDDGVQNISNILNEDATILYKKVYSNFKDCLLGNLEVSDYINTFKDDIDYDKIKYILDKDNLNISYPLIKNNYEYICTLKDKGYNLYILSNITRESYEYINNVIDIDKTFKGGIFSYKENIIKPDKRIYELIIDRYNLNKDETIFFDDQPKNIDTACEYGIKGIVFKTIEDIKNNIN